jgi:uncharacterized Zn-finger protein
MTEVPDCRDLNQAHRVIADGLQLDDSVPIINHDNVIIREGILFMTTEEMKIWLAEYAVFNHRLFIIQHSNENKCYIVICHCDCPWTVHARKVKDRS